MPPSLSTIAARQYGVFSRKQALAAGLTPARLRGRLCRGEWVTEQPQVYASATTRLEPRGRLWAVALSVGPPMAFTEGGAGLLLGLAGIPTLLSRTGRHARGSGSTS